MSFATRLNRLLLVLPEGMGAQEYVPPSKPYQLMADFYLVQFMQAPVGKRGQVLSQRAEELLRDLQYVERQLVPYLRKHLLEKAGYAIARELRHLFDATGLTSYHRPDSRQDAELVFNILRRLEMEDGLIERLYAATITRRANEAVRALSGLPLEDYLQVARAGRIAFQHSTASWATGYGGPLWQQAAQVWLQLYSASTMTDACQAIDLLYSLQHNNGNILDKNDDYGGDWLKLMLDLKFQAKEPEELLPYASSYLRQLAPQLLRALHGRSLAANYGGKSRQFDEDYYWAILKKLRQLLGSEQSEVESYITVPYTDEQGLTIDVATIWPDFNNGLLTINDHTRTTNSLRHFSIDNPNIVGRILECVREIKQHADRLTAEP